MTSGGKHREIDLNGKNITAPEGIQLVAGDELVVDDNGGGGTLEASGGATDYDAAIGGDGEPLGPGQDAGSLWIKKGNVIAYGPNNGAGIGGGFGSTSGGMGGTVRIDGGTLAASGGPVAAGIGGGRGDTQDGGAGGAVTVNGGVVTVNGGSLGTAIGGGNTESSSAKGGAGATVVVNGGTLNASGGAMSAAIGGGASKSGGNSLGGAGGSLTVNGGAVTATGSDQASTGIGGAAGDSGGAGGSITVNGGSVTSRAGAFGAGIGGGFSFAADGGAGATVNVNGGEVTAVGGFGQDPTDDVFSGSGIGSGVGLISAGAPGSLTVDGVKVAGSLTTGGQGGSNSQAPDISFASGGNKSALVSEAPEATPPQGSVQITVTGDPNPPNPPNPVGKRKQHLRAGATPKKIKFRGVTVLNKRNATTRENRPLRARARLTVLRGEVRCARIVRGAQRKLSMRTYGQCVFRVNVTYTAPGNSQLKSLKVVKKYRVKG